MITLDELDRIRAQVTKTNNDEYAMRRTAERQELQHTSKARVQNWPNTMEALRIKREEDRIKRLEDEEVSFEFTSSFGRANHCHATHRNWATKR